MDQTPVRQALELIEELECALAEFYMAIAELRPGDAAFWRNLEQEERQHATYVEQILALLAARADRFQANRAFNLAAIQTFTRYVEETTRRLKSGEIPAADEKRLLVLARDMEQSVIEHKYNEIVKSADPEYQALVRRIMAETGTHRRKIVARLSGSAGH